MHLELCAKFLLMWEPTNFHSLGGSGDEAAFGTGKGGLCGKGAAAVRRGGEGERATSGPGESSCSVTHAGTRFGGGGGKGGRLQAP